MIFEEPYIAMLNGFWIVWYFPSFSKYKKSHPFLTISVKYCLFRTDTCVNFHIKTNYLVISVLSQNIIFLSLFFTGHCIMILLFIYLFIYLFFFAVSRAALRGKIIQHIHKVAKMILQFVIEKASLLITIVKGRSLINQTP